MIEFHATKNTLADQARDHAHLLEDRKVYEVYIRVHQLTRKQAHMNYFDVLKDAYAQYMQWSKPHAREWLKCQHGVSVVYSEYDAIRGRMEMNAAEWKIPKRPGRFAEFKDEGMIVFLVSTNNYTTDEASELCRGVETLFDESALALPERPKEEA
uniref:Uncharacterized protein n=1 Tax=viral metagenome TaxID=1070528 RepID=A0A6M3LN20_9ZZZZ